MFHPKASAFLILSTNRAIRGVLGQGFYDVGVFQAIDQFLKNTGNIGRVVVGFFAGVEGLGGIGKDVHIEWDALRSLYSFELRVESTVMVLRTLAQYNYVSPIGIFRCNPVPDSEDPEQLLAACAMHNRSVTIANASTQYVFLCMGMGLIAILCLIKRPFNEDTYFTATAMFLIVIYGGSVRICRTEYTARRTVMELDPPEGWPRGDALRQLVIGVDKQLTEIPGLFERELRLARRCMFRAWRALGFVIFPQTAVIMLWLSSSPWRAEKWISVALAILLGIVSLVVNYSVGTAAFLMRIEGRDKRGIRECISAVWLMLNGARFTRSMLQFLSRAERAEGNTLAVATKWWRVFELCTALAKGLMVANVVLLGCGPPSVDLAAKIGFLGGTLVWLLAAFGNGMPF
ncbi:Fc.00g088860.m01.CDS01 [Cosmosporella sp. VM-42]